MKVDLCKHQRESHECVDCYKDANAKLAAFVSGVASERNKLLHERGELESSLQAMETKLAEMQTQIDDQQAVGCWPEINTPEGYAEWLGAVFADALPRGDLARIEDYGTFRKFQSRVMASLRGFYELETKLREAEEKHEFLEYDFHALAEIKDTYQRRIAELETRAQQAEQALRQIREVCEVSGFAPVLHIFDQFTK